MSKTNPKPLSKLHKKALEAVRDNDIDKFKQIPDGIMSKLASLKLVRPINPSVYLTGYVLLPDGLAAVGRKGVPHAQALVTSPPRVGRSKRKPAQP